MSRNSWILLGGAATAFLAFVVVEGVEQPFSASGGSGLLGLFRGGGSQPGAEDAGGGETPGAAAGADTQERRRAAAAAARLARKLRGKPGAPPDPELLRRMEARGGNLVATGPPREGQAGIVTQSFRAGRRGTAGSDGTTVGGGGGNDGPEPDDRQPSDPNRCGDPSLQKTVADLQKNPDMRKAFDIPCRGQLIQKGLGERFTIGDAPACVIFIPQTKNGGGFAIFNDRFLVSIRGKCIPNREYIKAQLRQ